MMDHWNILKTRMFFYNFIFGKRPGNYLSKFVFVDNSFHFFTLYTMKITGRIIICEYFGANIYILILLDFIVLPITHVDFVILFFFMFFILYVLWRYLKLFTYFIWNGILLVFFSVESIIIPYVVSLFLLLTIISFEYFIVSLKQVEKHTRCIAISVFIKSTLCLF